MAARITQPGDQEFERLLHDGITAAKSDQRSLAQSLLRQAIILNNQDARPYVWLSATTDDPIEQREYLEHAVAVDPTNAAARRSLAILTGKIDPQYVIPEGIRPDYTPAAQLPEIETASGEAQGHTFLCPQCGGPMSSAVQSGLLTCEYCGYVHIEASDTPAGAAGQVLDFVMPTALGHHWAGKQHRMACERCGAQSLLQAGQKTLQCPYCGSNQMITSTSGDELVDPQVVVVMKFDAKQAAKHARAWLGKGIFSPDDLVLAIQHFQLRPAYYSFWSFDGAYEARWTCEVKEGSGDYAHWVARNGVETRFFKDVLVPGVRALTPEELESIEPFDLEEGVEFKPDYLAGWPTLIYDRSLSDASLLAREKKLKELRGQLYHLVEIGREKRNFQASGGNWSGVTFKHLLLPLWIGTYHYQKKEYHVLINGQTGKVGGEKPRDRVKLLFAILIFQAALVLVALILYILLRSSGQPF